jgi:hypothetical protein
VRTVVKLSATRSRLHRVVVAASAAASLAAVVTVGVAGSSQALAASTQPAVATSPAHSQAAQSSAVAAATNPCAGKSQTYIVKTFFRGPAVYPLRCGTSTWGYNHLVAGHEYDPSMIALTIAQGSGPFLGVFNYTTMTCPSSTYRVVENDGALNGNGVRPQGIITAYWVTASAVRSAAC